MKKRGKQSVIYKEISASELVISPCELSARLSVPQGSFPKMTEEYAKLLTEKSAPAFSAVFEDVERLNDGELSIGGVSCESAALKKVLFGCNSALLLCATLGFGAERLLREYALRSPSAHFLLDALADALVEALCDRAEECILGNRAHSARISPGYADLPLSFTKEIVCATRAEKLLGVKLGESFLASPSKTVTAIIGVRGEFLNEEK